MNFLALSHAAPPVVIESATHTPDTIEPIRSPPSARGPNTRPTTIGIAAGISAGAIMSRSAAWVTMSTQVR